MGCSHGHGKGLGFGLFGFAGSWGRAPTKSLKCQENREPEKPTCRKVISGHIPAREMLPAGVSELLVLQTLRKQPGIAVPCGVSRRST